MGRGRVRDDVESTRNTGSRIPEKQWVFARDDRQRDEPKRSSGNDDDGASLVHDQKSDGCSFSVDSRWWAPDHSSSSVMR